MPEITPPGTRLMGAVPKTVALRGGLGTPLPAPGPPDPHAERATREGISLEEAKRRNHIDAYRAQQPQPQHPMPSWNPVPLYAPPNWTPGPQATASIVNQIRIGGVARPRCNHVLHATLTLLTCGLWAPIWAAAWLSSRQGN